jgi:hypothetical protein
LSELEPQAIQPALLTHPPGRTAKPTTHLTIRKLKAIADIVYRSGDSIKMGIGKGNCTLGHDTVEELTWTN